MGDDTLFARSCLEGLETEDMPHDLHERHVACQFVDGIDLRPVNVLVRIVLEQVTIGVDTEFLAQYLLPVRSHPREKLYILT